MARRNRNRTVWRLRSSFISSIISTTLVLYALGILALLLVNVRRLSEYVRENLGVSVILREDVKPVDAEFLRKTIDATPYVKSTEFISKERAAQELTESLGQDFLELLKYNPLSPSIELRLRAPWANTDSIRRIASKLQEAPQVADIHYEASLVDLVNQNVQRIGAIILAFSLLMTFIALVLINNTIRISVYARRFTIKTMQLVGATSRFVRRPFLLRAVRHGIYSSMLAIALLLWSVWMVQNEFYELVNLQQYTTLGVVAGFIILVGITINLLTTYFAVNKYLYLAADDLHY